MDEGHVYNHGSSGRLTYKEADMEREQLLNQKREMCCTHGLISRSDPRFSLLPSPSPSPSSSLSTTRTSLIHPFTRNSFPNPRFSIQTTRIGSFKAPRATINNGSVAAMPPPLTDDLSFYELLGIPETVTVVEIKQAYKHLARKYHPDVSPPDQVEEYTQRFIRVQEAYETLSDPGLRALYDRDMAKGIHLAFSARNRYGNDEAMKVKSEWKSRWQSQLSELKRRSMYKNEAGGNMSWGARMRRERMNER